jgi:hypothetical protein
MRGNNLFKLLAGCILLSMAFIAQSQNTEDAIEDYKKSREFLKDTTYSQLDSAVWYLKEALADEIAASDPDPSFVVDVLSELADWNDALSSHQTEYLYNYYAWLWSEKAGQWSKQDLMMSRMVKSYEKILKKNLPFDPHSDQKRTLVTDRFILGVREVLYQNKDTAWVVVDGGKNEGLYTGSRGNAFSVYDGKGRGNQYLGSCKLTEVSNTFSKGFILKAQIADSLSLNLILPNDRVELSVQVPETNYRGLIYDLTKLGVELIDINRNAFYYPALLVQANTEAFEKTLISQMLDDIHETAQWILDDETLKTQFDSMLLENGAYAGKGLLYAMKQSNEDDLKAFLRFVESFPAKYINRSFKVNETYATWLINNSPAASEVESWFLNELLRMKDSSEIFQFLQQNEFYFLQHSSDENIDISAEGFSSLHMYKAGLHTRFAFDLYSENQKEKAFNLMDKLLLLADYWDNDTIRSWYTIQKGRLTEFDGNVDGALDLYEKVIDMTGLVWQGHWYRGILKMNEQNEFGAIKDFEKVNELAPWFASAWGNRGWLLLKNGRPLPALDVCRKAYELDPNEMAWSVNLAHAYVFLDKSDSARMMYQNTLNALQSEQLFREGPLADFEFFIKNGVKSEELNLHKEWMLKEWEAHFKYKVQAKEKYTRAIEFHKNEQYDSAEMLFEQCIALEQKGRDTGFVRLRKYTRYLAYNAYKQKDYQHSLLTYTEALRISSNDLKDEDLILEDLNDVSNLHGWLGDAKHERMVRYQYKMLKRKKDEFTKSGDIYILSIGNDKYPKGNYQSASRDAGRITELLEKKNQRIYNNAHVFLLNDAALNSDSLNKALLTIINKAQQEDLFILYYAGYASPDKAELLLGDTQKIGASYLLGKLDYLRSRKKLLFFDCDHGPFLDQLMLEFQSNAENLLKEQDMMLLSPASYRSEDPLSGESFLTGALIDILKNPKGVSPDDPLISSKELESALYRKCGREGAFHSLLSFSSGLDFHMAFDSAYQSDGKDFSPPIIKLYETNGMRGGRTAVLKSGSNILIQGVVIDESEVISMVTEDGQLIGLKEGGRFEASINCNGKDQLTLIATDVHGNSSRERLNLSSYCPKQPQRAPKNFALLIGINEYEEWEDLKNPVRDVKAIGQILETRYGFETTYRFDLNKEHMALLMDTFLKRNYLPEDQLLIFIAGHGVYDPNYGGSLVCTDSKLANSTFTSYFKYSDLIMPFANKKELRNVLVVLDVCYGGELFNNNYSRRYLGTGSMDINDASFIKRQKNALSKQFITSGGKEYVSDGLAGGHSPFAEMFMQTLRERGPEKGFVVLSDFMDYTGKLPSSPQFGMFARAPVGSEEGDFIFEYTAPKARRTVTFGP